MVDDMQSPTFEEQCRFLYLYYGMNDMPESVLTDILKKASAKEIKEMVIGNVPEFLLVTKSAEKADVILAQNGLPRFSKFRALNTRVVNSILKKDVITNQDDAIVLRDALEGGLIPPAKLEKANKLLEEWL